MNYAKLAKVLVPALLGLAAVLGYQDGVSVLKSAVCTSNSSPTPVVENPDAGK